MNDSWDELNYALQTIIALIDEKDELIIVTGGGRDVMRINTRKKNAEVGKWHRRLRRENDNEYLVIPKANDLIRSTPDKETLLIFIGDGIWDNSGGPGSDLTRIYEAQKPRIIFFKIGDSATTQLEHALSGIPTLEVIFTPSGNSTQLKNNLKELAHKIVEGKEGNVKMDAAAGRVTFKPIFPLKKVIVLLQDTDCSVDRVNSGYDLEGPIDITNVGVYGSLTGKCYEVKSRSGSVIDIGKEVVLECSSSSCCDSRSHLTLIPIVALNLENKVEGNFITFDTVKHEYELCDKETEVLLRSSLVDMNDKRINLGGAGGLRITADNGSAVQPLKISGNEATGTIQLTGPVTYVTIESSYDGYFQKKSKILTFTRKECPLELDVEVLPENEISRRDEPSRIYDVCPEVKKIAFSAGIKDDSGHTKAFSDFRSVEIYLVSGGKRTVLSKSGDVATGDLELESGDTEATVVLEADGQKYETAAYTFRRIPCGPEKDNTTLVIETAPVMEFSEEGRCAEQVKIMRADGTEIDYRRYDFEVTGVPFEFKVRIDSSGNDLKICFEKNPLLCDCFIRHGTYGGKIIARPKNPGLIPVEKEWTFTLEKEGNFWVRCKTCLIAALMFGLLVWYLYGIWTKPRFHRTARFDVMEEDKTAIYATPNKRPRKWLKTTFFNRYIVPYVPESKMVDGMKFKASPNKTMVYLAKESVSEKLSKNGEPLNTRSKRDIAIYRNAKLELEKRQNITVIYTFKVK
ncbi:MAG: hypothetical protein KDD15_19505, partial [Lewinella sp.]|nr:hypothetical protein [Lewinella sp.]